MAKSFAPVFRREARRRLKLLERQFLAGDKFALMLAIRICFNFDLVAPDWVARAYIKAFDSVLNYRVGSWDDDEAFGQPVPKGKQLASLRARRMKRAAVYMQVREIKDRDPDRPLGPALFEEVGEKFGIGKTLAEELYYSMKRR